jgi:hypothetical protein
LVKTRRISQQEALQRSIEKRAFLAESPGDAQYSGALSR